MKSFDLFLFFIVQSFWNFAQCTSISLQQLEKQQQNLRKSRKLTGAFTGAVTIVKAYMPPTSTDAEIILATYWSGSEVNLQDLVRLGADPNNLSLIIRFAGPVFDLVNVKFGTVNRNETAAPFSLNGQTDNSYRNALLLSTTGRKNITVTGFVNGLIVDQEVLTFNIVNRTSTISSVPTAPVRVPVPVPVPVPVASPVPKFVPAIDYSRGIWRFRGYNATFLQKRHEACFVMVGRRAVLLGGRGRRRPNIYDPVTRTWTFGTSPPGNIELNHMQCVVVNNKVWIVSSWTGAYPTEVNAPNMYIYDPFNDTWETRPAMPAARRRGSAAVVAVGPNIYVAFGNIGGHETADFATSLTWLDVYDTRTGIWTALPDAKFPRDHTGGALMSDGRICVAAGRNGGAIGWPLVSPTECYNITSKTWSIEADTLLPRAGSAYGTSCDGKLLVAGGEIFDQGIATKQFDIFDGTKWTKLPDLVATRHSTGLAVDCVCNAIYIASGSGMAGGTPELQSMETFFLGGKDVPCTA